MTFETFTIMLKIISPFITFGVLIFILVGVTNTLNFTRRFNQVRDDYKVVSDLGNRIALKYIKGEQVGFDELNYYIFKHDALKEVIEKYKANAKWYNSDRFERAYYDHKLVTLDIDYTSIQEFKKITEVRGK